MTKLHIKKGDTVKVISGNDKGTTGEVLSVLPKTGKALVSGVNIKTKHRKPTATNPEGGIEKVERPILASKLMVVDGSGNASRIGRKEDENGKLRRYSKKTGQFID
ncbi:50S ribosomal protein L24 [bacterium]|nr:50S ribosomal protein L24 [bacterium]